MKVSSVKTVATANEQQQQQQQNGNKKKVNLSLTIFSAYPCLCEITYSFFDHYLNYLLQSNEKVKLINSVAG